MGNVAKRPNGRWRARWHDPDGRECARHFATKAEAVAHLALMTVAVADGSYIAADDQAVEFGPYAEAWRLAQIHAPQTVARTETLIRVHMLPTWERRRLGSIRPTEVQAWAKGLGAVLAPATVASVVGLFASIMRAAVDDRLLARSPVVRVSTPRAERRQVVPLEVDVVTALVDAIGDELGAAVFTSAAAGLRISEVLGLTVDRVDFLRGTIKVDRQMVYESWGWSFGPPKSRASNRLIPIPAVLVNVLAAHLAARPAGDSGLIFTRDNGGPWFRHAAGRQFRNAAATVRVELGDRVPAGTSWHDLRHFYASALIASGASIKAVQSNLGHATAAETLDTYAHLFEGEADRTRAAIEGVFGAGAGEVVEQTRTVRGLSAD